MTADARYLCGTWVSCNTILIHHAEQVWQNSETELIGPAQYVAIYNYIGLKLSSAFFLSHTQSSPPLNLHTYTVFRKNRAKCFINIFYKIWGCWQNLVHSFMNKFAAKHVNVFPHLNDVPTLRCGTRNAQCALAVIEFRLYPTSTVASKFARFEYS